ncbi:toprim domain-containing protein, partial [candidate division CSSED10-310 bacterium]
MSRYPQEVLDRIKRETDLPSLVRAKGVKLNKHGQDLIGLCPHHDDKIPSLVLTLRDGIWLWNCLGACKCGGDCFKWVMKADGVSFRHAVEILLNGNGSQDTSDRIIKKATVPHLEAPVDLSADNHELLRQVIDYYHETLKRSPDALKYLENRGIKSEEALEGFKLGFADRTLGIRLPQRNRKAGSAIRERLMQIGILRQSGHEHFNGSLIIPVMDKQGVITEVYGRKIIDRLRPGTPFHLYLPGPHKGIWNPQAFISAEIILCESLIDALSFWVNGFRNVTAGYGIAGFTDELFQALIDHQVRKVFIAYDRDDAGDKAAVDLAKRLMEAGIDCFRLNFPRNMDANEYAVKV